MVLTLKNPSNSISFSKAHRIYIDKHSPSKPIVYASNFVLKICIKLRTCVCINRKLRNQIFGLLMADINGLQIKKNQSYESTLILLSQHL